METTSEPITTTVTKPKTKIKNPKRVEQGKKLAARNKKIKEQIYKMQHAEVEPEDTRQDSRFNNKNFLGLGIIAIVVTAGFYYYNRKTKTTPAPIILETNPTLITDTEASVEYME